MQLSKKALGLLAGVAFLALVATGVIAWKLGGGEPASPSSLPVAVAPATPTASAAASEERTMATSSPATSSATSTTSVAEEPTSEPSEEPSPEPTETAMPSIRASAKPAQNPKATTKAPTRPSPKPAQSQGAPAPSVPTKESTFDASYARTVAEYIVEDIATADERFLNRPELGAAPTLGFLSENMTRLENAGMPPVSDPAKYFALVRTLREFYSKAEAQLPGDISGAAATYTVSRKGTSELLTILNPVLGTKHKLPPWSWM